MPDYIYRLYNFATRIYHFYIRSFPKFQVPRQTGRLAVNKCGMGSPGRTYKYDIGSIKGTCFVPY